MNTKQCKTCKREFQPKSITQAYCGEDCARRRGTNYPLQIECLRDSCHEIFEVVSQNRRKKYCSHRCSAIVINGLGLTNLPIESRKKCKRCNEPLSQNNRTYCKECGDTRKVWQTQDKIDRWKAGDTSEIESKNYKALSNWARRYLLELHEYKCTECGWCTPNPILGRPILTVDHIDGNWKNNKFDNLKVICYNCHTLTPTFGNMNRGSESGMRPYASERSRNGYTGAPRDVDPKEIPVCDCGNPMSFRAYSCSSCYLKNRNKNLPTVEELKDSLLEYNLVFSHVGSHYGVSDNAVRKWCRKHGLPTDKKILREMLTQS